MKRNQVLARAIGKYGIDAQQIQCVEECNELSTAILHHRRGKCDIDAVVTEIADVSIMVEQMKLIYGAERVEREIESKIQRLTERLGYVVER